MGDKRFAGAFGNPFRDSNEVLVNNFFLLIAHSFWVLAAINKNFTEFL